MDRAPLHHYTLVFNLLCFSGLNGYIRGRSRCVSVLAAVAELQVLEHIFVFHFFFSFVGGAECKSSVL